MRSINKVHSSNRIRRAELRRLVKKSVDVVQNFSGAHPTRSQISAANYVRFQKTLHSTNGILLPVSDMFPFIDGYEIEI